MKTTYQVAFQEESDIAKQEVMAQVTRIHAAFVPPCSQVATWSLNQKEIEKGSMTVKRNDKKGKR